MKVTTALSNRDMKKIIPAKQKKKKQIEMNMVFTLQTSEH